MLLVVALAPLILLAVAFFLPDRHYATLATFAGERLAGRDVTIGELVVHRGTRPTLDIEKLSVDGASETDPLIGLRADKVHIAFDLRGLLAGGVDITELTARGVELSVRADTDDVPASEPRQPAPGSATETSNGTIALPAPPGWLGLDQGRLRLDDTTVRVIDESGGEGHAFALTALSLDDPGVDGERALDAFGTVDALLLALSARIDPAEETTRRRTLSAEGTAGNVSVAASGTWGGPALARGNARDGLGSTLDMKVHLEADDVSVLSTMFGWNVPPEWGPVEADATLVGAGGRSALRDLDAAVNGESTLRVTGTIDSLMPLDDVRLELDARLASLREVSVFTPEPLPDIGPLTGEDTVLWQEGFLQLLDARALYQGVHGTAVATGHIDDLIRFDRIRLRADVDLPDFSALELLANTTLPDVDGVVASANLISTTAGDLYAKNLEGHVHKDGVRIDATGSIDSLFGQGAELNLELESTLDSLSGLSDLLGVDLPDLGPVSASARLSGAGEDIELGNVEVNVQDDALDARLRSVIGRLYALAAVDIEATADTPSLQRLLHAFGVDTSIDREASASATLHVSETEIELRQATLSSADDRLEGRMTVHDYRSTTDRPRITGELTVVDLDLIEPPSSAEPAREQGVRADGDTVLPDTTLHLDRLALTDLDLSIRIDRLISRWFDVPGARARVRVTDGMLSLESFSGTINGGEADLTLVVDATSDRPLVSLELQATDFDLSRTGLFRGTGLVENSGGASGSVNLRGRGDSIADVMSTANGVGAIYVENLLFRRGALELVSADLLEQLANAVSPSGTSDDDARFACSALAFDIANGVLTTPYGFATEARDFTVTGNARIDFGAESIGIDIRSRAKRGLGLGAVTNLVKLEGPLTGYQEG